MPLISKLKILRILEEFGSPATLEELTAFEQLKSNIKKKILKTELYSALEKGVNDKYIRKYHLHYFNICDTEDAFEKISQETPFASGGLEDFSSDFSLTSVTNSSNDEERPTYVSAEFKRKRAVCKECAQKLKCKKEKPKKKITTVRKRK